MNMNDAIYRLLLPLIFIASQQVASLDDFKVNAQNPQKWQQAAREEFDRFKSSPLYGHVYRETTRPKNVILFIGDGMSMSTITGARYMKAHEQNMSAGDVQLTWDSWPTSTLMRTFNADRMTTDSASAATAMFSGTKTLYNVIGLINIANCCQCTPFGENQKVHSAFMHAQKAGLSTGIVTTTRVTHATPAAVYAHTSNRHLEYSSKSSSADPHFICEDLATQLISNGIDLNVVLGGGSANFYQDPNELTPNRTGKRTDGRNLFQEWKLEQTRRKRSHLLVTNGENFTRLNLSSVDYLLGILTSSHMSFDIERVNEPSLMEMTEAALKILTRNPKGYLLMVEGGRIDHGHHTNRANVALTDTLAMEKAVQYVSENTNPNDTLIIVTADHSHSYGIVGNSQRTLSVLDLVDSEKPADGLPMLISTYFNGPAAAVSLPRADPRDSNRFDAKYRQQSLVPLRYSTHVADDVSLHAIGPFNELFHRSLDNTYVAHATMFSLCIGPYSDEAHCERDVANIHFLPNVGVRLSGLYGFCFVVAYFITLQWFL